MHPVIFVLGLLAAGWMAFAMSFLPRQHDSMSIGMAALFWIALLALVWTRWVRRPAGWLGRLAAAVALAMLATVVWRWTQRIDLFVDHRCGCARPGTFWKLIVAWAAGALLTGLALWGGLPRLARLRQLRDPRAWLGWAALTGWTLLCGFIMARNISAAVMVASLKSLVIGLGLPFLVLGVIAGLIWYSGRGWRQRRLLAKAEYLALDDTQRQRLLEMVERRARKGRHLMLYRSGPDDGWRVDQAHAGGSVLMPPGAPWSRFDGDTPAVFLLQLPLPAVLPAPWQGRLIAVWLVPDEFAVEVSSHAPDTPLVAVEQPPLSDDWPIEIPPRALRPILVPEPEALDAADDRDPDDVCAVLLRDARLRSLLESLSKQPDALLARLVNDDAELDAVDVEHGVWVGGAPQLIQNAHDPRCQHCDQPMRFLFSAGDLTRDGGMGDGGVAYIYGCDAHPEHCRGFLDCG